MEKASLLPPRANSSPALPPQDISPTTSLSLCLPATLPPSPSLSQGHTVLASLTGTPSPAQALAPPAAPVPCFPFPARLLERLTLHCLCCSPHVFCSARTRLAPPAPRRHSTRMTKGFRTCRCVCHLPARILFTSHQQQQQRASPWQLLRTARPLGFRCPLAWWLPSSCSFAHFSPSPREKGGATLESCPGPHPLGRCQP